MEYSELDDYEDLPMFYQVLFSSIDLYSIFEIISTLPANISLSLKKYKHANVYIDAIVSKYNCANVLMNALLKEKKWVDIMGIERIVAGQQIIYNDVIDNINQKIKSICCNIDTYNVPEAAKDLHAGKYVLDSEVGIKPSGDQTTVILTSSSTGTTRSHTIKIPVDENRTFYEYFTINTNSLFKSVSLNTVTN